MTLFSTLMPLISAATAFFSASGLPSDLFDGSILRAPVELVEIAISLFSFILNNLSAEILGGNSYAEIARSISPALARQLSAIQTGLAGFFRICELSRILKNPVNPVCILEE